MPPVFFILLFLQLIRCAPVTNSQAEIYLERYGYTEPRRMTAGNGQVEDQETKRHNQIKKFQRVMGLEESGELDHATRKAMKVPRCGREDGERNVHTVRHATSDGELKFNTNALTYSIDRFWNRTTHSGMTEKNTRHAIHTAFSLYSAITPLTFREVATGRGDIGLMFGEQQHGDSNEFDGQGGEYGHAFDPQDGSVHFDADEPWAIMNEDNLPDHHLDFLTATIHLIGHSLGIKHEDVDSNSIMAPLYKHPKDKDGNYVAPKLDEAVIALMQRKYGTAGTTTQTPAIPESDSKESKSCASNVYAAVSFPGHQVMLFPDKGKKVTVFEARSKKAHQYVNLSEKFPNGPTRVTGAYYNWHTALFMLFHGNQVWGYGFLDNGNLAIAEGYPKRLPVDDDWHTGAAVFSPPRSVLVHKNGTAARYNEDDNTMEIVGHVHKVYPNIPEDFSGIAMLSHGVFAGFTHTKVFRYNFEDGAAGPLKRIRDFITC